MIDRLRQDTVAGHVLSSMNVSTMQAILLSLLIANTHAAANFGSVLYDASDSLQIIDGTDSFIRMTRSTSSQIYLMEFYNSWCGHCIRYAPLFKEFARDIQGRFIQIMVLSN